MSETPKNPEAASILPLAPDCWGCTHDTENNFRKPDDERDCYPYYMRGAGATLLSGSRDSACPLVNNDNNAPDSGELYID